jgi:hypothetical protein
MTEDDRGLRQEPSANVNRLAHRISAETARLRAGIWAAIEALEGGDTWLACDILLALVNDGPEQERRAACCAATSAVSRASARSSPRSRVTVSSCSQASAYDLTLAEFLAYLRDAA